MSEQTQPDPEGEAQPTRRSTHVEHDVVYAAVGASAAPDLLRFPPEGSTPYAEERRLGSGSDRFLIASTALMTWGALRGSGAEIVELVPGADAEYAGVVFDERGTPQPVADGDVEYGPDGEPFLTAGTELTLRRGADPEIRRMRVVYTINEPRRVGFAWGAADDRGLVGEEVFAVEHRDDDTVWATVRGFSWPLETGLLGLKGKAAVRAGVKEAQALLAALVPGALAEAEDPAAAAEDPAAAAQDTAAEQDPAVDTDTVASDPDDAPAGA